jgi:hypothetical protein
MKIKFFAFVVVALAAFCVTLASGNVTTFKTWPFTVSVDLGMPCNDVNISKPVQGEEISGESYTDYSAIMCHALISIRKYYQPTAFSNTNLFVSGVTSTLLSHGADKDTIVAYPREINSESGAVGSGYLTKYGSTEYDAGFYVSPPKSYCYIYIMNNETAMVSALKTIHVTEAA